MKLRYYNQRNLLKKLRQVSSAYVKLQSRPSTDEKIQNLKKVIIRLVNRLKNLASAKQIKTALGAVAFTLLCSSQNLMAQNFNSAVILDSLNARGFVFPELVDWDNDGDLDVVGLVYNYDVNAPTNFYSENIGSPTEFNAEAVELENALLPYIEYVFFTESGDLDNDGDMDLVQMPLAFYEATAEILFFENNDGAIDTNEAVMLTLPTLETAYLTDASLVDFDEDGDLDLLSIGMDYGALDTSDVYLLNLLYYENIGDGTVAGMAYADPVVNPNGFKQDTLPEEDIIYLYQSEVADFDLDGDLDIVYSALGYYTPIMRYAENVDGTFADPVPMMPIEGGGILLMSSGDVDGDGDIDIIFDQYSDDDEETGIELYWLENTTIISNVSDIDKLQGEFQILGNPTTDFVILDYQFDEPQESARLNILNAQGQKLFADDLSSNSPVGQTKIDVSNFTSGIYHLVIQANGKLRTLNFVVE